MMLEMRKRTAVYCTSIVSLDLISFPSVYLFALIEMEGEN
jgi:hypothetical protein